MKSCKNVWNLDPNYELVIALNLSKTAKNEYSTAARGMLPAAGRTTEWLKTSGFAVLREYSQYDKNMSLRPKDTGMLRTGSTKGSGASMKRSGTSNLGDKGPPPRITTLGQTNSITTERLISTTLIMNLDHV